MTDALLPFLDRKDAGAKLAAMLKHHRAKKRTIIVGLLRGGIEVGSALAKELRLPLIPWNVRKIGHPYHREYGIGAIGEGGSTYLDEDAMELHGIAFEDLEPIIDEEMEELRRRKQRFLVYRTEAIDGRSVILTDDGAATGGTLFAAIEDMKKAGASSITVAIPVCPPEVKDRLQSSVNETVVLVAPILFSAVSQWYVDFPQLSDEEVLLYLQEQASQSAGRYSQATEARKKEMEAQKKAAENAKKSAELNK